MNGRLGTTKAKPRLDPDYIDLLINTAIRFIVCAIIFARPDLIDLHLPDIPDHPESEFVSCRCAYG